MDGFNIGNSLENGLTKVFDYVPQVLGALLLLIVGYLVAKVLQSVVRGVLHKVKFDQALQSSPAGTMINRAVESPSGATGKLTFWLVFLGFLSMAIAALNLPLLNELIASIYAYLPHVVVAVVIFLVASAVSAAAVAFVQRVMGGTPTAKLVSAVVPTLTMSIAVFMILNELMIAEEIVIITYTALIGAAALGLALAFGLGGRQHAAQLLDKASVAAQRNAETVKRDVSQAKQNTKREAKKIRSNR